MKIDLRAIDQSQFVLTEGTVAGEKCTLVTPTREAVWTADNTHLRSSMWNSRGELISASWRKHFNWAEQPTIHPPPADLDEMTLVEKIDGSTLLISAYKGELIVRTRGTFDATKLPNGGEIERFKDKYHVAFETADAETTLVCEWVSPSNQIVLKYPEPDLYLTGMIFHQEYSYANQYQLDTIAYCCELKRPRLFSFSSIDAMLSEVAAFKGIEGVCAYYPLNGYPDNCYRKIKGTEYLTIHRFKDMLSVNTVLDLWMDAQRPKLDQLLGQIADAFSSECSEIAKPLAVRICAAFDTVNESLWLLDERVKPWKLLPKKEAALLIQSKVMPEAQGTAFQLLSGKPVNDKQMKKLMLAVLNTQ